jgi:hypothetical protein
MNEILRMKYVGKDKTLKGKVAVVKRDSPTSYIILARFEDPEKDYGWMLFDTNCFEEVKK